MNPLTEDIDRPTLIPVTQGMRARLAALKRPRERYEDVLERAIRPLERKAAERVAVNAEAARK